MHVFVALRIHETPGFKGSLYPLTKVGGFRLPPPGLLDDGGADPAGCPLLYATCPLRRTR